MILDNKNENQKVYGWLKEYTESGKVDIVNIDMIQDRTIDLLNENITIEAALELSAVAKETVEFLKQEKVLAKTLEPNFCHAKIYLTVKLSNG